MSTLYSTIHAQVRLYLKGTVTTYPDELILNGINGALDAILPWLPKKEVIELPVTSGSMVNLPDDAYYVDAVYYPYESAWLDRLTIKPGIMESTNYPKWLEYPDKHLTLSSDSLDAETLQVYYFSPWDKIASAEDTTSLLDTPSFADLAIIYYASSYCMAAAASATAQLRQFGTKIDSGTPTDNPLKDMASYMMQRFLNEVKLYPMLEKVRK